MGVVLAMTCFLLLVELAVFFALLSAVRRLRGKRRAFVSALAALTAAGALWTSRQAASILFFFR